MADVIRSKQILKQVFPLYKDFINRGFDPNDVSDIVFSQIGARFDELTKDDLIELQTKVENYYNVWDKEQQ